MAIRKQRFPEYDLSLCVVSGMHTAEEAIDFFQGLDGSDATRWLTYYEPDVDMSQFEVAGIPELKRMIAAKEREIFGDKPQPWVVVSRSEGNEAFFKFWRSFAEAGEQRVSGRRLFPTLEAACEWLGLPEAGRKAVVEAAHVPTRPRAEPLLR